MDFDPFANDVYEAQYAEEMAMLNGFGDEEHAGNSLTIDEEIHKSPQRKRPRMEETVQQKPRIILPTTLDDDKEERELRRRTNRRLIDDSPAMIDKILRYRENRNKDSSEFLNQELGVGELISQSTLRMTKVLLFPPVHSDFISSTSTNGQRCYMRIQSEEKMFKPIDQSSLTTKSRQLLTQSVSEMRQEIILMKERQMLMESHRLTEKIRKENIRNAVQEVVKDSEDLDKDEGIYSEEESSKPGLWLDKFAPTQYTHLLSDENVNRSLLRWLKLWDKVVFGRELQPRKEHKPAPDAKWKKPFFNPANELDDKLDEYDRPHWKISLLCGPPGLGKTTLAHIIAKHAGYHVVEMNASDDRSPAAFKNKLEETTQMRSVLGNDERPNCLIIDEIDGAPQAAIAVLLNAINKQKKVKKQSVKKSRPNGILLRPIICICNDLYVPSLRQMRQNSFILHFPQTQSTRLASRLVQLCRMQHLQSDMTTLLALCEKSDNDIRSCINTLQFAKSSGSKLDAQTVKGLEIGQKDQHKNIFHVWREIFQLPKNKRKMLKDSEAAQLSSGNTKKMSSLSSRLYTISNLMSANGDYDKTLNGVFENFLKMKFKDHDMFCINKAAEWLRFYDCLSEMKNHLQEWSILRYSPYLFVVFHMMFSCNNVPRINFPTQHSDALKKSQRSGHLLESLFSEMSPNARCFVSSQTAVLDVVPYVLAVMVPTVRPVNTQLFSEVEKKLVKDLISTMLSYNLSYIQERNEDGQYIYQLEPKMGEICEFEGVQDSKKLSYATKQMIAKELEMERMRRSEHIMEGTSTQQEKTEIKKKTEEKIKKKEMPKEKSEKDLPKEKSIPNHLQTLETSLSQATVRKDKPAVDFFSRFERIKRPKLHRNGEIKEPVVIIDPGIGNSHVWYKFNEGFSNAVRQTVYIKDLL